MVSDIEVIADPLQGKEDFGAFSLSVLDVFYEVLVGVSEDFNDLVCFHASFCDRLVQEHREVRKR